MEKALMYELNKIPEIRNRIFPTNAPKGQKSPYLVYMIRKRPLKDLNGTTKDMECSVMLNILSESYLSMRAIADKVEKLILTFPLREIGDVGPFIEDLTIDEITDTYEPELQLQRGIIPFDIYYKEA